MRQVVIEQTRFLSTVFLGGEFKLENIYSGVNCYLRELILADRWKNRKNRKKYNRKRFVPHGIASCSNKKKKKQSPASLIE